MGDATKKAMVMSMIVIVKSATREELYERLQVSMQSDSAMGLKVPSEETSKLILLNYLSEVLKDHSLDQAVSLVDNHLNKIMFSESLFTQNSN